MARSLGWLFIAGATIGLISLFLPRAPHTNVGALAVNIGLAYLGGVIVLVAFRRMPAWTFHVALLAGAALITRAVYYSGQGVSYYGIWYLWAALFGFSFFRRTHATVHVALVGLAYAVVLAVRHEPTAQGRWVTTIASLLIAGVFIDALVRRVRRQHQQAAQDAENLADVVNAMHRIFQQPTVDATRVDLCSTAARVARADSAVLWEPRANNRALVPVAVAGEKIIAHELLVNDPPDGAAHAYMTGQPCFAPLADQHGFELDPGNRARVHCALWQPVLRDQTTVAVLALYWLTPVAPPEQNVRATIVLLAAQAAIAIERVDLLARLERIAHTDELTGLLNRRAWQEELPREMARAKRQHWPLCVAMLDIDGLKKLNDSRGHHAGDQLLKQNAAAWSSALRPVDRLARYGGDEFAAVLTGCRLDDAQKLVERLADATPDDHSFSVGIAEWDGTQDVHALMAEADARLYAAKDARAKLVIANS
ncbi:MAG TPA: GGDEF domain-containing protein [Solirubrobacteraceae bacterium]|nr:GGDEF domain-containing protein [Solirubrobacteraceae bacterium]